jgi:hypothetical protein
VDSHCTLKQLGFILGCIVSHIPVVSAVLRVTPDVMFIVEPVETNVTLNCSSRGEGSAVSWNIQLPNKEFASNSLLDSLPLTIMAEHAPGFTQLCITGTLETNGSAFTCRASIDGNIMFSESITTVFYGKLDFAMHVVGWSIIITVYRTS